MRHRIEACKARVKSNYPETPLSDLYGRYDALLGGINAVKRNVSEEVALRDEIIELRLRRSVAKLMLTSLESLLPEIAREIFTDHLHGLPADSWIKIRDRAPESLRLTISTVCALKEKLRFLDQMKAYLFVRARDLEGFSAKLRRYIPNWNRRAEKELRRDMTWSLVTVPAQLASMTADNIADIHILSRTVCEYGDYALFDRLLGLKRDMLFWDLAVHHAHGPFPHDAFVHHVLPDVRAYHEAHPEMEAFLAKQVPEVAADAREVSEILISLEPMDLGLSDADAAID